MVGRQRRFTLIHLAVCLVVALVVFTVGLAYYRQSDTARIREAYQLIDQIDAGAIAYFQEYHTFVGGSFEAFGVADRVETSHYFQYQLYDLSDRGFLVTAIPVGDWAPAGAVIHYSHDSANPATGYAGTGCYVEDGWN